MEVDLSAVNGGADLGDGGVEHGVRLLAFVDAAMADSDAALLGARNRLRAVLPDDAFVDACATIGAFNVVDRISDSTGIALDDSLIAMSAAVRDELGLERFGSAANTPTPNV